MKPRMHYKDSEKTTACGAEVGAMREVRKLRGVSMTTEEKIVTCKRCQSCLSSRKRLAKVGR